MIVRMLCDCCDTIFGETELPEDTALEDFEALTEAAAGDIILHDGTGAGMLVSSTCDDCKSALGYSAEDAFCFYRPPVYN